ncbi:MAG: N-acyl homoserine lactonase family protein [Chloroflexota bacterium]
MKTYTIRPIPLGLSAASLENRLFRSGARAMIPMAVNVFYIQGATRHILVDSGVTPEETKKHGFVGDRHLQTLPEGLAKLGLKPENIELVIQTHLHFDHCSYAPIFTKAKFLVQKAELEYQRNPPPYEPRPCPKEILGSLNWEVIEGDYQVEEDIKILFTPGHTAGGQSVAVNTTKGLAIIEGLDATDELYNPPSSMPWTGPVATQMIHTDPALAYASAKRIKEMADIIVPLHEARWVSIDKIPWA